MSTTSLEGVVTRCAHTSAVDEDESPLPSDLQSIRNRFLRAETRDSGLSSLNEIALRSEVLGALAVLLAAEPIAEVEIVDVGRSNVGVAVSAQGSSEDRWDSTVAPHPSV